MHSFIIAAVAQNKVIGANGNLPWNLPADQAFFAQRIRFAQKLTGRVSFESKQGREIFGQGKDLIVLTSQHNYQAGKALVAHNLEEAWHMALSSPFEELAVLGGAEIYKMMLSKVDTLYLTEIHAKFEGDTFFPDIPWKEWKEWERKNFAADQLNPYPFSFVTYRRKN